MSLKCNNVIVSAALPGIFFLVSSAAFCAIWTTDQKPAFTEAAAFVDDDFTAVLAAAPESFIFSEAVFVLVLILSPVSFSFNAAASFFAVAAAAAASFELLIDSCVAFSFSA